jgi:hypothetical protein
VKSSWRYCVCIVFLGAILATTHADFAHAQTSTAQGVSASGLLGQLSTVFSNGQVVQSVQLSGSASWYAGSLEDSGTVTLTASTTGSSQMQLQLSSTGQRTESQTGTGSSAACEWAGANGVANAVSLGNCWRPDLWFLPALSLQPTLLPSYLTAVDLGVSPVGFSGNTYCIVHEIARQLFSFVFLFSAWCIRA